MTKKQAQCVSLSLSLSKEHDILPFRNGNTQKYLRILKLSNHALSYRMIKTTIFLLPVLPDLVPHFFENHQSEENDGKRAVTRKEEVNG